MNKATALRHKLRNHRLLRSMGSHNALTAKLAENNGFDAVWASSFEISTSYCVPDASILTMTEFLAAAQAMNDAISIPIIADCDSGFGDAGNVEYMVRKYENAGIAAVCIEDKQFPKTNSFVNGHQDLIAEREFVAKIRAGCEARKSPDFMMIARTETLIAGGCMQEALQRANAYADAGADAILIHSRSKSPDEVYTFASLWDRNIPIIAVPTTYYSISATDAEKAGIQILIYANHAIRSAVYAMNQVMQRIMADGTSAYVEPRISSVAELLELQGIAKIRKAVAGTGTTGLAISIDPKQR